MTGSGFWQFVARAALFGFLVALLIHLFLPERDGAPGALVEVVRAPPRDPAEQSGDPVSYGRAVRAAAPAVVNVYTAKRTRRPPALDDPLYDQLFRDNPLLESEQIQTNLGSGVIISAQGVVVTNHHVIADADEVRVLLNDGRSFAARILGTDPDTDLAVLGLDARELPAITLGNSEALAVGDVVLAIGNPFGVGQTVTMGIVSATGRDRLGLNTFEDFIQTDAAINPGNSGGALVNAYGELVGINTAIFSRSGGSQGIGFAIPVGLAREVAEQILAHGQVIRGWLGVQARNLAAARRDAGEATPAAGVLITGVYRNGPAHRAGVQAGDLLLSLGGVAIRDTHRLLQTTAHNRPGTELELTAQRDGRRYQTRVTLSQRPGSG